MTTVRELIAMLSEHDPDAKVFVENDRSWGRLSPFREITVEMSGIIAIWSDDSD